MRKYLLSAAAVCAMVAGSNGYADEMAAKKWIDEEFQPSVLTKDEQLSEMQWFIQAAQPFKGMADRCTQPRVVPGLKPPMRAVTVSDITSSNPLARVRNTRSRRSEEKPQMPSRSPAVAMPMARAGRDSRRSRSPCSHRRSPR